VKMPRLRIRLPRGRDPLSFRRQAEAFMHTPPDPDDPVMLAAARIRRLAAARDAVYRGGALIPRYHGRHRAEDRRALTG
jgi:hypothetical protein